jgi:nucleoside-diphosphate-sugar epimerase
VTTLVTGAGLVGSLVAERIARGGGKAVLFDVAFSVDNINEHIAGLDVEMVRGDITEVSELIGTIGAHGITTIVHTAALLTSTVNARPMLGVRTNLMGTLNVLEAARLSGVERIVFCSAFSVTLGRSWAGADRAVTEDEAVHLVTEYPPTIYGTMKLASEWLSHNFEDAYGLRTISMRLGGVFGPWRGAPSGGPSRLVQQIVQQATSGQAVRLSRQDLEQRMDFVYARDVAKGLVLAAQHESPPSSVYNHSGGRVHSVRDAVGMMSDILGTAVELEEFDNATSQGAYAPGPTIDISRIRDELGFEPDFPLDIALRDYATWLTGTPPAATGPRA